MRRFLFVIGLMVIVSGCADMGTSSPFGSQRGDGRERDEEDYEGEDWKEIQPYTKDGQTVFTSENCAWGNSHRAQGDDGQSEDTQSKDTSIADSDDNNQMEMELSNGFTGGSLPAADILFVLDTGDDMDFYLEKAFHNRFGGFLSELQGIDWRLMVTNTDYKNRNRELGFPWIHGYFTEGLMGRSLSGKAMKLESEKEGTLLERFYLDSSVSNYEQAFINTITRNRSGSECGYPPYCHRHLVEPLKVLKDSFRANRHFIREEADFVVVIISNSDEQSKPQYATKPSQVISEFEDVFPQKRLFVFSLVIPLDDNACLQENRETDNPISRKRMRYGKKIIQLVEEVGRGGFFSICKTDYSEVAEQIACQVSN